MISPSNFTAAQKRELKTGDLKKKHCKFEFFKT